MLKLSSNWHIHPTFNEALLTPYMLPAFSNQEQPPPPPPDLIDGAKHYEVEKFSTVENAKSEEKQENHGAGSWITLSNGKAMDQSQTVGYRKTTWMPMNSLMTTSLNT